MTGWLLAAAVAAGIILRWSTVNRPLLIGLVGVLGLALLAPLAALAGTAWRTGSRPLRGAAALLVLAYLGTFGNVRAVIGCGADSPADGDVRIFLQNVYVGQADPAAVAAAMVASGADVAVLVEAWPPFRDALARQPGVDVFSYRLSVPGFEDSEIAVWSRWPLADVTGERLSTRPFVRAEVQTPAGPFTIGAIHTAAPTSDREVANWSDGLAGLGLIDRSEPIVLAGDFNATIDHAQFRRLLENGWTDVHTTKGCGFDQTWPVGRGIGIPVMRLDHVLVSDQFEVKAVEVGPANGSDHKSVIATIHLR
ncbi:MAG: endonuclease/exonuclease/phosphatase family protein [Acidimicrobiia bacterium]|nr:endonuclease/exonuclease/phosphatase family protein [Acidimicrobiia bacterium]